MVKFSIRYTRPYMAFCNFLLRYIIPKDITRDFKSASEQNSFSELEKKLQGSQKLNQTLKELLSEKGNECKDLTKKFDELKIKHDDTARTLEEKINEFKHKEQNWSQVNQWQKHTIIQFQKEMFAIIKPLLKGWHSQRGELYDLVLILDLEKKIAVANPKLLEHLGYSYQELLDKESFTDIIYFKDGREKVMKGDYSFEDGIDLVNKEGKLTHLRTHMRDVPSPEQPLFTFVYLRKEGRRERRRHAISPGIYSGEVRDGYREIVVPPVEDKKRMKELYREMDRIKNKSVDTITAPERRLKREFNLVNIKKVPKKLGMNLGTICKLMGTYARITNAHTDDAVYNDLIQNYHISRENISTKD